MQFIELGTTGFSVSKLSFGAAPFGDVYGELNQQKVTKLCHQAIDAGINLFDTSPYYGLTLSETRLGEALKGKRKDLFIATKCGRYGVDDFDFSEKRIRKSVEESLKRLQTDYIDIFQLHDTEFVQSNIIHQESIPAIQKLKDEGKVRAIGITGYPVALLSEFIQQHQLDTVLSYCHYNLMNTSLEDHLIPIAQGKKMGIINASPMHMGILTEQGAPDWHPAPDYLLEVGKKLAEHCKRKDLNISKVALWFALKQKDIHTTLVGMNSSSQLEDNLKVLTHLDDPTYAATAEELDHIIGSFKNRSWEVGLSQNHESNSIRLSLFG